MNEIIDKVTFKAEAKTSASRLKANLTPELPNSVYEDAKPDQQVHSEPQKRKSKLHKKRRSTKRRSAVIRALKGIKSATLFDKQPNELPPKVLLQNYRKVARRNFFFQIILAVCYLSLGVTSLMKLERCSLDFFFYFLNFFIASVFIAFLGLYAILSLPRIFREKDQIKICYFITRVFVSWTALSLFQLIYPSVFVLIQEKTLECDVKSAEGKTLNSFAAFFLVYSYIYFISVLVYYKIVTSRPEVKRIFKEAIIKIKPPEPQTVRWEDVPKASMSFHISRFEERPENEEIRECILCGDFFENEETVLSLKCSEFNYCHQECIEEYIESSTACPFCERLFLNHE